MNYFNEIKSIFPSCIKESLVITKTTHGLSNANYKVYNNDTNETILLRIYGENYKDDIEKSIKISNHGFGAKILHMFKEGRIEEWIDGRDMSHRDININTMIKIALKLKRFHSTFKMNHNDLHFKNIMLSNHSNDIHFIDFEYSGKLDVEFDIANFFNEWMHDYDSGEWYRCHTKLFPSMTHIRLFCHHYGNVEIDSILRRLDDVNRYWADWSACYSDTMYRLFEYDRRRLIGYDFNKLLKNKTIYCDGIFDLLHTGHISFLKKIRALGCRKLIVGIISDENAESYKRRPIVNQDDRGIVLSALTIVDKVIVDCPFNNLTEEFLDSHGIDLVTYGGDPSNPDPLGTWKAHYQVAIDRNALSLVGYSEGNSTSGIINRIKEKI